MVALVALLFAWGAFFPVPLGAVARFGLVRAFPSSGPLQVGLEAASFRWRWGQPAFALEVRDLSATARTRPLATVHGLVVEIPKAGLWKRHFAPAQITIAAPHLTLDQTPEGALTLILPPSAASTPKSATPPPPAAAGKAPDLTALAAFLPAPGGATRLVIDDFAVQLRTKAGEARVPFGRIETTLTQSTNGVLQLDADLPLIAGAHPPRLTLAASLAADTGRGDFSVKLPAFATTDLPVLPGAPPLPLQATVALDATGHYDLAAARLDDIAGGLSIIDGELVMPDLLAAKLRVDRVELRGHVDLRAQRAALETGRVRLGPFEINIAEFETTLGEKLQSRWQMEITGLRGASVLPLLPPSVRTLIPLKNEAIALLALNRATTRGSFTVHRDAAGVWSSEAVQAEGRLEFGLGNETLACLWSGRHPLGSDALTVEVSLLPFVPARWPAALLEGTPAGAVDVPLAFTAQATLSPQGVPRAARIAFTGAPGTLRPLQAGMPPLAVRRFEVRVETEDFAHAWRVPVARLELANGAGAELINTSAQRSPGQIAAQGDARATGLSGDFIALWLPPGTWAPLSAAGLEPRDVLLARVGAHFNATVAERVGGGWQAKALAATADAQLRLHAVPLNFSAQVALPDSGTQLEATVDLAEFRPAQLRLILAPGLTTAAVDFPLSLHAVAHASLKGDLATAEVQVRGGAGRVKTPPAFGDLDVAFKSLALDANYDPLQQRAQVKTLQLDVGGVRLNLADVSTNLAPPYRAAGRLAIEPFALGPVLKLWPASQQPELRRTVLGAFRAGEFLGAQFDWGVVFDPAAQPSLEISRFHGTARLGKIEAVHAAVPGPIALGGFKATVDYPKASVELQEVAVPGVRLAAAQVEVSALDSPTPAASVTASFDADLGIANRAWKFAPPDLVIGSATGSLSVQAPFNVETLDVGLALDLKRATVVLAGFPNAMPDTLTVTARMAHALSTEIAPTANFELAASQWLGAPLRMAGHATLAADDHHPTLIELSRYEHGATRLQIKFSQPDATHRALSLTGAALELGPLMRAGLAAADAFAAAAPAKPAPAPAAKNADRTAVPAAPMSVTLDIQVDRVAFGAEESALKFELHTRLEDNWPASFTLEAFSGVGNRLQAEIAGPVGHQIFTLSIGNAAGWLRTLTSPWSAAPPAPGQFGSLNLQIAKVPATVSGGGIVAEMELRPGEPEWLRGRFELSRATLIRPTRILQALALKTGKVLGTQAFIEKFSIGEFSVSHTELRVANIVLAGTGLVDRVKIKTATYGLLDDKLLVDGEYFGIGFEFHGTLASPGLPWLKDDNKLIRAIGVKNEFDFDDAPAPAPKPKKK